MLNIRIEKTTAPKAKPADESKLGFGKIFSDHMALVDWSKEEGWHDARIVPFGYFSIHPASTCLHYGSEIFEGLKAYRTADGNVQLFRPEQNAQRMIDFLTGVVYAADGRIEKIGHNLILCSPANVHISGRITMSAE